MTLPIRSGTLALLLGLAPAGAWACLPDFHERETPHRIDGANGAVAWEHDAYQRTGIGPAEDLGQGFVIQWTFEGNACYGETSAIVQDCSTGAAVAVGGAYEAMADTFREEETLFAWIEVRPLDERPDFISEITAQAVAGGVESVVPMRTDSRFSLGEFQFQLGEACRTFYPGLPGTP